MGIEDLSRTGGDEVGGDNGNHQPADEASDKQRDNISAKSTNTVGKFWVLALEIVVAGSVATGFWLLGERFISHGNRIIGDVFNYVADCLYFATAPLAALKLWEKPKLVWSTYALSCLILIFLFAISSGGQGTARPNVHLMAWGTNDFNDVAYFTNDFFSAAFGEINPDDVKGCLVVPIVEGQSNAALRFGVHNGFGPPVVAYDVKLDVSFPINVSCEPETVGPEGWKKGSPIIQAGNTFSFVPGVSLNPGFGAGTPYMKLHNIAGFNEAKPLLIAARIRVKDMPDKLILFKLYFEVSDKEKEPLIREKRNLASKALPSSN